MSLTVNSLDVPESRHCGTTGGPVVESVAPDDGNLERRWNRIGEQVRSVEQALNDWIEDAARIETTLEKSQDDRRIAVERALAERGLDAGTLREIQALNRQASLLPSHEANLERTRKDLCGAEKRFALMRRERLALIGEQREALDRVVADVERAFGSRIRARRTDNVDCRPLDEFLRHLKQKGITRWWNDLKEHQKPAPDALIDGLGPDSSPQGLQGWPESLDPELPGPSATWA